ncbi:ParB/Sulfiredoxin [Papiliotrema laurentii]|uniref:sulfiredoxin n=1 Tax=Papiliotrema laurentii TaxID=5418 RepID=A0AAD9CW54_PAPLA|nr:ParB/Sulfiredoxin [Papiliotrema laurentii]
MTNQEHGQEHQQEVPQPGSQSAASCLPPELLPQPSQTAEIDKPTSAGVEAQHDAFKPTSSVFARNEDGAVHNVPMRVIHRPLPSELDEDKVKAFMKEMEAGDTFTPIELAKVRAPLKNDPTQTPHNFYFAMGGCHRYEATKRLGWETIRARIIDVPASQMRIYLGAGSPF